MTPSTNHHARSATPATSQITLEHPTGRLVLRVPTDTRIDELMPEFLDVTGQPAGEAWVLTRPGQQPFAGHLTLSELGVEDDAVLVLHGPDALGPLDARRPRALAPPARPSRGRAPSAPPGAPARRPAPRDEDNARPLSARNARSLPRRLAVSERVAVTARALAPSGRSDARKTSRPHAGESADPRLFTRPERANPLVRAREAWARTGYCRRLEEQITRVHLTRSITIAVVSPKGGVGKSTTAALIGSLLAHLRRDRVVAVDTNPDWGSLGRRLVPGHGVFIDDLLAGPLASGELSPTQLDGALGRGPDGLMVAPAPTDPVRANALDEPAYRLLFERLRELAGTLVLDCGTGLDSPPARAALSCSDQLLLVSDGEPDTASLVAEAAQHLRRSGPPLILVANRLERSSRADTAALECAVAFARGIARVPAERVGAQQLASGEFSWTRPPTAWATPLRELAALLSADWVSRDLAR
jgi:MinD-like ATPase involved in chromosome partitioning or flagellar assembly